MNKNKRKYKIKTHAGAKKRFKVVNGDFYSLHAGRHKMARRTRANRQKLRQVKKAAKVNVKYLKRLMPYYKKYDLQEFPFYVQTGTINK
jgi:ribosomal protein L35